MCEMINSLFQYPGAYVAIIFTYLQSEISKRLSFQPITRYIHCCERQAKSHTLVHLNVANEESVMCQLCVYVCEQSG